MKIEKIRITNHHLLRDITLSPGQSSLNSEKAPTIDLLVGINGTGKSTLLRSLAIIFQCLEQGSIPPFGFEIRYRLDKQPEPIFISNLDQTGTRLLRFRKGTEDERVVSRVSSDYLPRHIIALTSGSEADWIYNGTKIGENDTSSPIIDSSVRLEILENQLQNWYDSEVPSKQSETRTVPIDINPNSRFLFVTENLIPYIVLCGLLSNMCIEGKYLDHVLQTAQIERLCSFSLQLHIDKDQIAQDQIPFIVHLWENATYITRIDSTNYLLVFALSTPDTEVTISSQVEQKPQGIQPQRLLGDKGDGLAFLNQLLRLLISNGPYSSILRKVNLFLESGRTLSPNEDQNMRPSLYLFSWLSDGERSFLGRLCLLPLLRYTEALVLLDEPEVHFNDYWKRQLIQMISQALQRQDDQVLGNSHVIMTTHSSITLSDIANTNIWMLERHHDNESKAIQPLLRTLGTDPSDIIVHIFRAESAIGAYSATYIRAQVRRSEQLSPDDRLKFLKKLLEQVGPGYWRYLIRREILSLEAPELWNIQNQ